MGPVLSQLWGRACRPPAPPQHMLLPGESVATTRKLGQRDLLGCFLPPPHGNGTKDTSKTKIAVSMNLTVI
jgi:hypothetical protein